jgi:predicted nucleic acid-binding protein
MTEHKRTLYLDVCCLNRLFDEQTQGRVCLEADAVMFILQKVEDREWQLLNSDAIEAEVRKATDPSRREGVQDILALAVASVSVESDVTARASVLITCGFTNFDALHIACAEAGHAEVFLTTDDRLLKRAHRLASELRVRVENPVLWYTETIVND